MSRRVMLTVISLWGLFYFWQINQVLPVKTVVLIIGLASLLFIWFEIAAIFLLIFLTFLISYSFYGLLFFYSFPSWLIMIGILIVFGYLFLYVEQKIGILGNQRLIYLILFCFVILEVFLSLGFFLINSISKSLIMAAISYLFVGFSYTVLARHEDNKLSTYLITASIVMALIFLSSSWGGLV